jgi:hypothetical protein
MADNPFKVGDKVKILPYHLTNEDLHNEEGEITSIHKGLVIMRLPMPKKSWCQNIDLGFTIHENLLQRLAFIDNQPSTKPVIGRQEAPCRTCGRPNDVGASSCWLCGNSP